MPQSLTVGAFVFGAILVLIAIIGGQFELFGAKIAGEAQRAGRIAAGALGVFFLAISLIGALVSNLPSPLRTSAPTENPTPHARETARETARPAQETVSRTPVSAVTTAPRTLAGSYGLVSYAENGRTQPLLHGTMQLTTVAEGLYAFDTSISDWSGSVQFSGELRRAAEGWYVVVTDTSDPRSVPIGRVRYDMEVVANRLIFHSELGQRVVWERR